MIETSLYPGRARRNTRRAIAAAVLSAGVVCGMPPARADALLDEVVDFNGQVFFLEQKVPALVLGVVRNGEISIRGFGERAGKGSKAPDGETVMRIGSITKAFTGEVLAHLATRNAVQLAQPLTTSWPELAAGAKADAGQIRLIDLATQSGGLPREVPHAPPKSAADPFAPITVQAFTDWFKNEPLLYKPGRSVHYSNFGFDLLAHAMSRAADKPYPALLEQYITAPLGLKDTVFALTDEQRQRLMQGHGFEGEPLPEVSSGPVIVGSGGLYSTPNDLLKWMQWHLDRFGANDAATRVLDHSLYLVRDGLQSVTGMDESGHMDAMGLGWVAMMPKGDRPFILQKAGGLQGTFTYIAFAPARGMAVFVAINKFDIAAAMAMAVLANDLIATLAPR